jgi:hypothetical protein
MVEIVNAVSSGVRRPIQFCHLPVPKPRTDAAYRQGGDPGTLLLRRTQRQMGLRRSGTESSSDSLLEGSGFELLVRGRGEFGTSDLSGKQVTRQNMLPRGHRSPSPALCVNPQGAAVSSLIK